MRKKLRQEENHGKVLYTEIQIWKVDVVVGYSPNKPNLNLLHRAARWIFRFLRAHDRIRQYVIEMMGNPKLIGSVWHSELVIRQGYCRFFNSVDINPNPDFSITNAVIQSLPLEPRIEAFCNSVKSGERQIIPLFVDSFALDLLWELSNFLDGRFKVVKGVFGDNFSVLHLFKNNHHVLSISQCADASHAFGELLARFQCIANSKDLRPRRRPWSRKFLVRSRLNQLVNELKKEWIFVDKNDVVAAKMKVKKSVRLYLEDIKRPWNYRASRQWSKGLRYVFRYPDEQLESAAPAEPILNLDTHKTWVSDGRTRSHDVFVKRKQKIIQPLVRIMDWSDYLPVSIFKGERERSMVMLEKQELRGTSQEAERRKYTAFAVSNAIQTARAMELVTNDGDDEDESDILIGPSSHRVLSTRVVTDSYRFRDLNLNPLWETNNTTTKNDAPDAPDEAELLVDTATNTPQRQAMTASAPSESELLLGATQSTDQTIALASSAPPDLSLLAAPTVSSDDDSGSEDGSDDDDKMEAKEEENPQDIIPGKSDVCFGLKGSPGFEMFLKVVKETKKRYDAMEYCPKVYSGSSATSRVWTMTRVVVAEHSISWKRQRGGK